jgi:hypothetical protein
MGSKAGKKHVREVLVMCLGMRLESIVPHNDDPKVADNGLRCYVSCRQALGSIPFPGLNSRYLAYGKCTGFASGGSGATAVRPPASEQGRQGSPTGS